MQFAAFYKVICGLLHYVVALCHVALDVQAGIVYKS